MGQRYMGDGGTVACVNCESLDYPGPGHQCEPSTPELPVGWSEVDTILLPLKEQGRSGLLTTRGYVYDEA